VSDIVETADEAVPFRRRAPDPVPGLLLLWVDDAPRYVAFPLASAPQIIGREAGCVIAIPEDATLSRKHAEVSLDSASGALVVRDVASRHGTYVDGERVHGERRVPLARSVLRVGAALFLGVADLNPHLALIRQHPQPTSLFDPATESVLGPLMRAFRAQIADAAKTSAPKAPTKATAKAEVGDAKGIEKKGKAAPDSKPAPSSGNAPSAAASLLGLLDPELGAGCAEVLTVRQDLAATKAGVAVLEAERDDKATTPARKAEVATALATLRKSVADLENMVGPKQRDLVVLAKGAATKISPALRDKLGPALAHLRHAVDDASLSANAAAVRYPLAVPTLIDSTKAMVPVIVADVVEHETGKRPVLTGFQPGVTLEGGKVQITLNGLTASDLGRLSVDRVAAETVTRTQAWVTHALGLLGSISATKDTLAFEADLLDALLAGMKASGFQAPEAPDLAAALL